MNFEEFRNKYQKVPVDEYPNTVLKDIPKPMVSCRVSTYMHAPYIKQCLDGVLMQKTEFPFEIVIGEDESNDGTREICSEYAQKYPDKIRLFLHSRENNIHINNAPSARFQGTYTTFLLRGKYQAICEGDDYWTDPYKLQKQVDFLEENPDYGLVHTECDELLHKKQKLIRNIHSQRHNIKTGFIFEHLLYENFIASATVCIRANALESLIRIDRLNKKWEMGDFPMWLDISKKTKIGYLKDNTTVRRILENSASKSTNPIKNIEFVLSRIDILKYFIHKYDVSKELEQKVLSKFYRKALLMCFRANEKTLAVIAYKGLKHNNEKLKLKDYLFFFGNNKPVISLFKFLKMFKVK